MGEELTDLDLIRYLMKDDFINTARVPIMTFFAGLIYLYRSSYVYLREEEK